MSPPSSPAPGPDTLLALLSYEPRELRFGTSGRRGEVVDLTQLEVYTNALAELQFLLELPAQEGGVRQGDRFYFAYDLRPSSSRLVAEQGGRGEIAQAVERAITDAGLVPVNLGRIPTPALLHYAAARGTAASWSRAATSPSRATATRSTPPWESCSSTTRIRSRRGCDG